MKIVTKANVGSKKQQWEAAESFGWKVKGSSSSDSWICATISLRWPIQFLNTASNQSIWVGASLFEFWEKWCEQLWTMEI